MFIWIIIPIIIVCAFCFALAILRTTSNADKIDTQLILQKSIEEGHIKLPECEYAFECYLLELELCGQFPDCTTCQNDKLRKQSEEM
jgi:hypothetical protein